MSKRNNNTNLSKGQILNKHKSLVTAKTEYMDLLTVKIFNYILFLAQESGCLVEAGDGQQIITKVAISDIIHAFGYEGHSVYDQIWHAAKTLDSVRIFIQESRSNWTSIVLFDKVSRKNGDIEAVFSNSAINYIKSNKLNYTSIDMYDIARFESVAAIRLFEVLKSKAYKNKNNPKTEDKDIFEYELSLDEARFYVNSASMDKALMSEMDHKKPNYTTALTTLKEREKEEGSKLISNISWDHFKNHILDKAINEINEKTDIHVEYKPVRTGKGGKVSGIRFMIDNRGEIAVAGKIVDDYKTESKAVIKTKEYSKIQIEMNKLFESYSLLETQLMDIAEAHDYDLDSIKEHIKMYRKNKDSIRNMAGWLIMAGKDKYVDTSVDLPDKSKKNAFTNFTQQTIDFDMLEKALVANQ